MSAKHPLRSGFRVLAATAIVAGAVMNLATPDAVEDGSTTATPVAL